MKTLDKNTTGWVVARVWLDALEETARDFHGIRPRAFIERAYQHATETLLRILEQEYGLRARKASTIKEAIQNYIELCVKVGLFDDASQFRVDELDPYRVEVEVAACPYGASCRDLSSQAMPLQNLTCARIGCFKAAVEILTGIECNYEMTSTSPGTGCKGTIEVA
jgi:hypothetical protein